MDTEQDPRRVRAEILKQLRRRRAAILRLLRALEAYERAESPLPERAAAASR